MRPSRIATSSLLLIVGAIGCQKSAGESRADPETSPTPAASVPSLDTGACVARCMRARQMEAVGVEVIEASCKESCAADPRAYDERP